MENLKYTFSLINDWIKAADQKAMILGSLNVAGFIFQFMKLDNIHNEDFYSLTLSTIAIIATCVALFFWLSILYPRIDNKHKKSRIFFQHIANAYSDDISGGIDSMMKISDKEYEKDLASQIVINAGIAKKKYESIQNFIWAFAVQLLALILLIIEQVTNV